MSDLISEFQGQHRFLSNFYPSPFTPPTLEHHFQAAKAQTFEEIAQILAAPTATMAKRLGRAVFLVPGMWDMAKRQIMFSLLLAKFSEPNLRAKLIGTYPLYLQEGNRWHDHYWGFCLTCKVGENKLGHLLMKVRDVLRT